MAYLSNRISGLSSSSSGPVDSQAESGWLQNNNGQKPEDDNRLVAKLLEHVAILRMDLVYKLLRLTPLDMTHSKHVALDTEMREVRVRSEGSTDQCSAQAS